MSAQTAVGVMSEQRAKDMYVMYAEEGKTFQQIADHYGISKQRVAQILHNNGFETHRRTKCAGLDLEAIYARYQAGYTIAEISRDYEITPMYLAVLLRKRGYATDDKPRGYVWTPERLAALKADYDSGMAQSEIAKKYGVWQTGISSVMRKYGISRRPQSEACRTKDKRVKKVQS